MLPNRALVKLRRNDLKQRVERHERDDYEMLGATRSHARRSRAFIQPLRGTSTERPRFAGRGSEAVATPGSYHPSTLWVRRVESLAPPPASPSSTPASIVSELGHDVLELCFDFRRARGCIDLTGQESD